MPSIRLPSSENKSDEWTLWQREVWGARWRNIIVDKEQLLNLSLIVLFLKPTLDTMQFIVEMKV